VSHWNEWGLVKYPPPPFPQEIHIAVL
jgi:hypothetical protein